MSNRLSPYTYEVGGSLPLESPTYVSREVDEQLYHALAAGQFCHILNARQMGKSSLRVRVMQRLLASGAACADIDLSIVGGEGLTAEEWYAGISDALTARLNIVDVDLPRWWSSNAFLSPVQRFAKLLELCLEAATRSIIIFFDELDSVLPLTWSDDFFALLRGLYNRRSDEPMFRRLVFCLVGVANPGELVQNPGRSPFNVGQAIELEGFTFDEAWPALGPGLADFPRPEATLREILAWTGGQPFLTQKLCSLAAAGRQGSLDAAEGPWIEALVRAKVIQSWESQDQPVHLRAIRDRILSRGSLQAGRLLGLYQRSLRGDGLNDEDSRNLLDLRLSGLVIDRSGHMRVANRIYASIFDQNWVERRLNELRPYAAALDAWTASGRSDSSCLLTGETLRSARNWGEGKRLAEDDYLFLAASEQAERARIEGDLQLEKETNRILAAATARARRRVAIGSSLLGIALAVTLAVLVYLGRQRSALESEMGAIKDRSKDLRANVWQLSQERTRMEKTLAGLRADLSRTTRLTQDQRRTLETAEVEAAAAVLISTIGQDRDNITSHELNAFAALSSSSLDVKLTFLRHALKDDERARRLRNRMDLAINSVVGLSSKARNAVVEEIVLPCVRKQARSVEVEMACMELGTRLGLNDRTFGRFAVSVLKKVDRGDYDAQDIGSFLSALNVVGEELTPLDSCSVFSGVVLKGIGENPSVVAREQVIAGVRPKHNFVAVLKRDSIKRVVAGVIVRMPPDCRDDLRRRIMAKVVNRDSINEFWLDLLFVFPGDLSPEEREVLFDPLKVALSTDEAVRWVTRINSGDAPAAFDQLMAKFARPAVIEAIGAKAGQPKVDKELARMTECLLNGDCRFFSREIYQALRKGASVEGAEAASEALASGLLEMLKPREGKVTNFERFMTGAEILAATDGRLGGKTGRLMILRLLTLIDRQPRLGWAIVLLVDKLERTNARRTLLRSLKEVKDLNALGYVLLALARVSDGLSEAEERIVLARIVDSSGSLPDLEGHTAFVKGIMEVAKKMKGGERIAAQLEEKRPRVSPEVSRLESRSEPGRVVRVGESWVVVRDFPSMPAARPSAGGVVLADPRELDCTSQGCGPFEEAVGRLPSDFGVDQVTVGWGKAADSQCSDASARVLREFAAKASPESAEKLKRMMLVSLVKVAQTYREGRSPSRTTTDSIFCLIAGISGLRVQFEVGEIRDIINAIVMRYREVGDSDRRKFVSWWEMIVVRVADERAIPTLDWLSTMLIYAGSDETQIVAAVGIPVVASRVRPAQAKEALAIIGEISSRNAWPATNLSLAKGVNALRGPLNAQDLVDVLKRPGCTGELKRAVVERLAEVLGVGPLDDVDTLIKVIEEKGLDVSD